MKKIFLPLIAITVFSILAKSQAENADLNKIANALQKVITSSAYQEESFGPIKIVQSNFEVFKAGNNITTQTIRKLQLSKKFQNDDSLFRWLIPNVNKILLKNYFNTISFYKGKYDTLFNKLTKSFCPCINIASHSKDMMADNNFMDCAKRYLNDTAVISEYQQTFFSIPRENRQYFFSDLLTYSNLYCDEMFNKLIVLANEEVPDFFKQSMLYYKGAILEDIARYSLSQKKIH
jgi:hypothetical protein